MALQEFKQKVSRSIDEQVWLDDVSNAVEGKLKSVFDAAGEAGQPAQDFLNGTWLGHPLHPVITDVPIGSFTAALVLDFLEAQTGRRGYGRGADVAVGLGVGAGLLAAASGFSDWQHTVGKSRRVGILHALLNSASMIFYGLSLIARMGGKRSSGRALTLAGFGLTTAAAYLGGNLVYEHHVGIDHSPRTPLSPAYIDVMHEDELGHDRMVRKEVDGVPVLLVRRGETVHALAETCAHLGGPLADGELRADGSVVCPWHASRFDLATGKVLNGPSAYNQPCYQARIRDHRVEIRQPAQFEVTQEA